MRESFTGKESGGFIEVQRKDSEYESKEKAHQNSIVVPAPAYASETWMWNQKNQRFRIEQ